MHGTLREGGGGVRATVGIVLGAGSFRGAAHVGVMRALERAGIPIDLVVGVSAGALAGLMYCAGMSVAGMDEALRRLKLEDLFTPATGPDGFTDMRPVRAAVESLIGADRSIGSLPRRFACVATDALAGTPVVISEGNATSGLLASMALPGLVRPAEHEGRLFFDGGVVQPMPVSVARALGAQFVIAVDVHVPRFGSRIARHPAESLTHAYDMAVQRLCDIELATADVVIRPELKQFEQGLGNVADFLAAGERAGADAVDAIRARTSDARVANP
jgi:NTE family protein